MASALDELAAGLAQLAGRPVALERQKDPSHGDYSTNVALQSGQTPREFAQSLAERAVELPAVERAEVAGPGFLNLWVSDAFLGRLLSEIDRDYGGGWADRRARILVEMVSANPTGPITVASARNGALGDSIARLLEFAGNEVEREYYYNDAGSQMQRFRASV